MISVALFALLIMTNELGGGAEKPPIGFRSSALAAQSVASDQTSNAAQSSEGADPGALSASYRLSGEKSLRPSRIGDDGVHMYLEWSEEQALPAVFALNTIGEEEMVDGYMRQGIFTIDRVHKSLVFRIGKKRAKAERVSK